ncbi:hypothetical protein PVK06_034758 [Gossypium arboreum]|uniref:Gag-pol polyprotein n=1 Tax=Gossypium arboreum TaxID=29729 RepID=A0ABR0NH99_GOSAR|nr:hypothetical protein PVK06_034758 [Gossypium arboreum]
MRESISIAQHPLLLGSKNYAYWKACMRTFNMSSNKATCEAIEEGWTQPIVTIADCTTCPKDRSKYIAKERKTAHGNLQTLNFIFSGVSMEQFKIISTCD